MEVSALVPNCRPHPDRDRRQSLQSSRPNVGIKKTAVGPKPIKFAPSLPHQTATPLPPTLAPPQPIRPHPPQHRRDEHAQQRKRGHPAQPGQRHPGHRISPRPRRPARSSAARRSGLRPTPHARSSIARPQCAAPGDADHGVGGQAHGTHGEQVAPRRHAWATSQGPAP